MKRIKDTSLDGASADDRAIARKIVEVVDGLPLALDQAGAYVYEMQCSLSGYLDIYEKQWTELLRRRGGVASDHRPVATTWSLSFEKVEKANPAAADILRLCAFLAPDAIPEEILTEGADELGPVLQPVAANPVKLNAAIGELLKYSLIRRDPVAKTMTVHRLVQAVLKDEMDEHTQHQWAERAVRAVYSAAPDVEFETWPLWDRLLPHALACATLITQWDFAFPEAARLLNQTGLYLVDRLQYEQAELLYQQALVIKERVLGPDHSDTTITLDCLAMLYTNQSKYEQAELLYQQALAIREQVLGSDHPDTAESFHNLALFYDHQGKFEQAEPLYQRALAIEEQVLGPDHPDTANSLNNLALLYDHQGKFEQAEPLHQRALAICEKVYGPNHPQTATCLFGLALLYTNQSKYEQAEPLHQRALAICEKVYGPNHPHTATCLNNLAGLYDHQGKFEQAEPLYQRALAIREKVLGPNHLDTATSLNDLAEIYHNQGKYEQAESLYQQALTIYEQVLGPNHPNTKLVQKNYTDFLQKIQQKTQATSPLDKG